MSSAVWAIQIWLESRNSSTAVSGASGTGESDTADKVSLFLTYFDFLDQEDINSEAVPSETSGVRLNTNSHKCT